MAIDKNTKTVQVLFVITKAQSTVKSVVVLFLSCYYYMGQKDIIKGDITDIQILLI